MSIFKTLLTEALDYFTLPTKISDLVNDKNYVAVNDKDAWTISRLIDDSSCKNSWGNWGQYQEQLTVTNSTLTVPINSRGVEFGGGARYYNPYAPTITVTLLTSNTVWVSETQNNFEVMTPNVEYTFSGSVYLTVLDGASATFSYKVYGETEEDYEITTHDILDLVYPVGSIYMSLNPLNPSMLFGGEWASINNKFLLASGTHSIGTTGGSEYVPLSTNEMPSHTHIQNSHTHTQGGHTHKPSNTAMNFMDTDTDIKVNETKRVFPSTGSSQYVVFTTAVGNGIGEVTSTTSVAPTINEQTAVTNATGGGSQHYNMPPYLVVYMWERVS